MCSVNSTLVEKPETGEVVAVANHYDDVTITGHRSPPEFDTYYISTVLPRILLHAGICRDLPGCRYTPGFTGMQLNVTVSSGLHG